MTTRERHLLFIVVGILGIGFVGGIAYLLVLSPLIEKNKQIKLRENEIAQLELDIAEVQILKKKFESAREQSLPNDPVTGVGVSRTQYANLLEGLLRRAEFAPGSIKILVGDPDSKSAPTIAPKRPAYTKLTYDLTVKGELYHLVDFMQHFYQLPLLHTIKKINIIRPSDTRTQGNRQLDVTMTVEALVLDNAQVRGTLLPVVREIALVSGTAAYSGLNAKSVAEGRGSPIVPTGVLADTIREYLAIDGKNPFYGLRKEPPKRDQFVPPEDDHSPFVTLTSIIGYDDGKIVAVFRDKLDNHNYVVTQSPTGVIGVKGEWLLSGEWKTVPGYSATKPGNVLFFGTIEGQNRREWRVRRVYLDGVVVEKIDPIDPEAGTKPKPHPLSMLGGGIGNYIGVADGKVYRVSLGQTLEAETRGFGPKPTTAPTKYMLLREAWKDIFGPLAPATSAVSEESRGK
jgi:hypothetical protein